MFVLKLKEREIKLKWGTWAMARVCKLAGNLPVNEFFTTLLNGSIEFDKVCYFLRAGIEYANNGECELTDMQLGDVIDEAGGLFLEDSQIMGYFKYITELTVASITPLPSEPKPSKKKLVK